MKKITLKELQIRNFKGVKSKKLKFSEKNYFFGKHGSGKTTIFDAFIWTLFGKDSQGKSDFQIKPIGQSKVETEVICLLDVNGDELKISRIFREKYTKEGIFSGNETIIQVNDIVYKSNEYQKYINDIISEDLFKLLTSITYFMSLHWEKQRQLLYSLIPNISDSDIATTDEFKKILEHLKGVEIEKYVKDIEQKIRNTEKEIDTIPSRIDEAKQSIPSDDTNFIALELELDSLLDIDKSNEKIKKQREEIEQKITSERKKHEERYITQKQSISDIEQQKRIALSNLSEATTKYQLKEKQIQDLRNDYQAKHGIKFVPGVCPINKSVCNVEGVFKSETEFNKEKAEELQAINVKGKQLVAELEELKNAIEQLQAKYDSIIIPTVDFVAFDDSKLRSTMPEYKPENPRIKEIQMLLGQKEYIEKQIARVEELEKEQKDISERIIKLRKTKNVCDAFIKRKSEIAVEKINDLFEHTTWKLYETLINGNEVPCCNAYVGDIPFFGALNTASRMNVGIDIINTFSKFNDTYCPVFADNMESCTEPIDCVSQTVYLVVDKNEKELILK